MIYLEALIKRDLWIPTQCLYRFSNWIRIMVQENMTSQIKLFLVVKLHRRIPSIISVKISCQMNIWHVNIATKHIKLRLDGIDTNLNVKKETNHLITRNTIYHLLVMITIQQLPKQLKIEYLWSQTGNTISSNTINIANLFLLPSGLSGKRYIKETTRLLNE